MMSEQELDIRRTAHNIIENFLMEQGMPRWQARDAARKQVADSPLNLLKKILAGGCR